MPEDVTSGEKGDAADSGWPRPAYFNLNGRCAPLVIWRFDLAASIRVMSGVSGRGKLEDAELCEQVIELGLNGVEALTCQV